MRHFTSRPVNLIPDCKYLVALHVCCVASQNVMLPTDSKFMQATSPSSTTDALSAPSHGGPTGFDMLKRILC